MQRCYQTWCCSTAEGWRSAAAQEPVQARRLGGGVPGALPWQDPTTVPRDHQAQPGPVLAWYISSWHSLSVSLLWIHNHSLAKGAKITTNHNLFLCLEHGWVVVQKGLCEKLTFCRCLARCNCDGTCTMSEVFGIWGQTLIQQPSLEWKGYLYCYTCKPMAGYQCAIRVCIDFLKPER